jgi:hypothetical protein
VAANDYDGAEPVSETGPAAHTAAVVGLDAVATETLTLLLEILGWSVVAAQAIEGLPTLPQRLVFIDESLFLQSSTGSAPEFASSGTIVLVGTHASITFIGIKDATIHRIFLPLDIAQLESIIASSS